MSAIYLIGFIQSLFVSSLFLLKKQKKPSDYVLSFYILVMGFFLFFIYSKESGFYDANPLTIVLDILYWVWIGPALFVYIDLIVSVKQRFKKMYLLHLIPMVIVLIGFSEYFINSDISYFEDFDSDWWFTSFATYVWYYNSHVYYLICIVKLLFHRKEIKHYFSNTSKRDLKWLFHLANGFAAFLIFGLITGILRYYFEVDFSFSSKHYTWLVMVIYIFGIGYYGYVQKGVFADITKKDFSEDAKHVFEPKSRYEKSGLSEEESLIIQNSLLDYMKNEKPYLDAELNLTFLAEKINTTSHKLSQVINEKLKLNFYDFVNKYRVEDAKQALCDPQNDNLKILTIAWDCGFNSKSVFYSTFKKFTNQTPSQYRNTVLKVNYA
ncbi:MAG: AraC family transcriptional regulator [Chloroflexia bacterium]|nr:AraC family transcriptional regulator [Chloroflexia bacterium]